MKFEVVGNHTVCGFPPGSTVDEADLVGADVAHLIASGHIAPVVTAQKNKPTTAADGEEK